MAGKPGTSKTAILTDALRAWFDRQGAQELYKRFGHRFDRQSRASEHKLDALTELVGVFVQHQLSSMAHLPLHGKKAAHLGRDRFYKLLSVVEQRLAEGSPSGRLTGLPLSSGDDP